ncbi:MAG TPA: hypothetical protein VI142_06655 [Gaiellaceae bacterium]
MEAAEQTWRPLGELLVEKGLVTKEELDRALTEQEETGRLLGTILVERGFVSGPALAVALAEQYGVEVEPERGFGTGLWAEIDRRHRAGRGLPPAENGIPVENVVQLEPAKAPQLEAVPDPEPEVVRLLEENRRLEEELERLREEHARLKVVEVAEVPEQPSSHVVFLPTPERYLVLERQGPPPEPGEALELPEGSFVVGKVGRAPFPGERRPCAFLLLR